MITPKRWYLYTVDLEPRVGTKPGKQRPCLAIQPNEFVEAGLKSTVVLPITSKVIEDAFPLRVNIPHGVAGLTLPSDILVDQILAWSNEMFRREIGILPDSLIADVKLAIKDFLDLG